MAFMVLCLGSLMIVLDVTIINVALPSIRTSLGFSQTSLAWVVNSYLLTFGGFLLLGGRLGDLFGPRRVFVAGIVAFTLASVACGLATSQAWLVAARAVQGLGGAAVAAVSLSLTMALFVEPDERAGAMGVFGFVEAGGGSVGVLLGGVLTGVLDWHWIFFVNAPIGVAVTVAALRLLPPDEVPEHRGRLDVAGAVMVTLALLLAISAVVGGNDAGWASPRTVGQLGAAGLLLAAFAVRELRATSPLMPLGLFRYRSLTTANVIGVLWAAAIFAWFFLSALYLQLVLGYGPLHVGLAFLPANVVMGALSVAASARLVTRFGTRKPLVGGLLLATAGLLLFSRAPLGGHFPTDVLPAMVLLGLGAGIAFNPLLLAAMSDADPDDSGIASGIVNTSFMMGGALGLAVMASVAAARTSRLVTAGRPHLEALLAGYRSAFLAGALCALAAAALTVLLPDRARSAEGEPAGEARAVRV